MDKHDWLDAAKLLGVLALIAAVWVGIATFSNAHGSKWVHSPSGGSGCNITYSTCE